MTIRHPHPLLAAALLALALGAISPAHAQNMDFLGQDGKDPLTIDASGGIEWNQRERVFIASGPARATRGDLTLDADQLRAYYRDAPQGGNNELYRLDAIGNVRITQPGRVATGNHAVYDVDKAVIVLKDGHPVRLDAGPDVITTDGQLEFWQDRKLAVARAQSPAGAQAVRADRRIQADVLTAQFGAGADGKSQIELVEAFDNVRITTAQDEVFANRAAYNVPTGLARLTGSVKIRRGENVINGCSADIDLNTGVSRLNSCEGAAVQGGTQAAPGGAQKPGRVHGVLAPKDQKKK